MTETSQSVLLWAAANILRPLIRILLRNGIAHGMIAELTRKLYVDVAYEHFAPPGKKQTVSRIASLTGLTRKEVKRLLETETLDATSTQQRFNRAIRVISGWTEDARFSTSGETHVLPLEGPRSFQTLVKDYSGDMPSRAMLSVLEEAGTVQIEDNQVRLVRRAYVPAGDATEKLRILGNDTAELIQTVEHNLTAADDELRYQRKVHYPYVTPAAARAFDVMAAERAQVLLEDLNEWLAAHYDDGADEGPRQSVSLGIYFFQDQSPEKKNDYP